MKSKSILIFSDWYAPGYKAGGPIRSCVNLAAQMKKEYNIYIITSDRDSDDKISYPNVPLNRWIDKEGVQVCYVSPDNLCWRFILEKIRSLSPDFIYLNSMFSVYFTIYPLLMKRMGKITSEVVLAPRGMLQAGALNFKALKKKLFLSLIRFLKIPRYIRVQATDEQEKLDVQKYLTGAKEIQVIPNFSAPVTEHIIFSEKHPEQLRMVFISRISPKKNLLFLLKLLLKISVGNILLTIRGSVQDESYWRECEAVIDKLPKNISVEYDGPVENAEVGYVIQNHHLFVLPTLGENFGHAIFEALAVGRPVLISDQTPWRNLEKQLAGWDIPLNKPDSFAEIIGQVAAMDNKELNKWCRGASNFAKQFSEKANLKEKYRALFS